jgi:SAM-dependent methyltransferase
MADYTCPICSSKNIHIFLEIFQIPVYCNVLWETKKEALDASTSDMLLGFCKDCGHIYNYNFNPAKLDYSQNYDNALHFSKRFRQYAESTVLHLIKQHRLYGKDIIEIGSGDGYFLKLLCKLGKNRGVGFDPSSSAEKFSIDTDASIEIVRDFYSERYFSYKADFICCRHVLEHIQFPQSFLKGVRRAIGDRFDVIVFFEVPNAMYTIKDLGIWDLIYEHCSYFTEKSLTTLFTSCDFKDIGLKDSFEGQFLCIEAQPSENKLDVKEDHQAEIEAMYDYVKTFSTIYNEKLGYWRTLTNTIKQNGQKAVTWGAGSKGVSFLNSLKMTDGIQYAVDINQRKHGKFISGTGQQIVPPEFLLEMQPDFVILMNSVYRAEVKETLNKLGLCTQLLST